MKKQYSVFRLKVVSTLIDVLFFFVVFYSQWISNLMLKWHKAEVSIRVVKYRSYIYCYNSCSKQYRTIRIANARELCVILPNIIIISLFSPMAVFNYSFIGIKLLGFDIKLFSLYCWNLHFCGRSDPYCSNINSIHKGLASIMDNITFSSRAHYKQVHYQWLSCSASLMVLFSK